MAERLLSRRGLVEAAERIDPGDVTQTEVAKLVDRVVGHELVEEIGAAIVGKVTVKGQELVDGESVFGGQGHRASFSSDGVSAEDAAPMTKAATKRGAHPVSTIRGQRPVSSRGRAIRADAVKNREKILAVASRSFGEEGLDVPLDELARRAGVGAGTVYRHFPTKELLIDAVVAEGVASLARDASALVRAADPTAAFCAFFAAMIARGAAAHALGARLARAGVDVDAKVAAPVAALRAALAKLLRRAQRAGGIRKDLDPKSLDAILAGAHAIQIHPAGGGRWVEALCDAIRAR
jgi:AcrR family transcriptional regulator